jgi:hypothetical protein
MSNDSPSSPEPRDLEFGPISPYGGLFARDLRAGDTIRTAIRGWSPIRAIEDSPHGERALELESGEIVMTDLAEDEIFEVLPGTIAEVGDVLHAAQSALIEGYLDVAGDSAVLAFHHRDATDAERAEARSVLAAVLSRREATR